MTSLRRILRLLGCVLALFSSASAACAQEWLSVPWSRGLFGDVGTSGGNGGQVNALAQLNDTLIVAGSFDRAGGEPVNNVARWTRRRWEKPMSAGLDGEINALAVYTPAVGPPTLFAAGNITLDFPSARVAAWIGKSWVPVGTVMGGVRDGPSLPVVALCASNSGILYAAERGASGDHLWAFSAGAWSDIGTVAGFNATIETIHESGGLIYVGGDFSSVSGVPATRLAIWNGGGWSTAGGSFDGAVRAMADYNDGTGSMLYVGGDFTHAVKRLHNGTWEDVAGGLNFGINPSVRALLPYSPPAPAIGSFLIAGGDFFLTATDHSQVAAFNGSTWGPVADGIEGSVRCLASVAPDTFETTVLYAGGTFYDNRQSTTARQHLSHVGRVCEGHWRGLGGGFGAPGASTEKVSTLAGTPIVVGKPTVLYAGGDFQSAGGLIVNHVARWRDGQWMKMGEGTTDGPVNSMVLHDDGTGAGTQLYAAGLFNTMDGVSTTNIARWTEAPAGAWSAVGAGLTGMSPVQALAVYDAQDGLGPNLYAAGGLGACRRWTGTTWINLPTIPLNPPYQLRTVGLRHQSVVVVQRRRE